jgi:hypothetical protein
MSLESTRDEVTRHLLTTRAELTQAIDGLSREQLIAPSIDGWSVKDHLAHLAFWDELRANEILRISAGYETAWPLSIDISEAVNAIVQPCRSRLSLPQVLWELESARRRVLDAVAAANERGLDGGLYGEAGLRTTHDLAHAAYIRDWRARAGI